MMYITTKQAQITVSKISEHIATLNKNRSGSMKSRSNTLLIPSPFAFIDIPIAWGTAEIID